jgi:hypothetical protein
MDINTLSAQVVISQDETWLVPLVASAIGALIGGTIALLGIMFNHRLDVRKQTKNEEDALQSLYRALQIEFSEIWDAYNNLGAGVNIVRLKDGDALMDDFGSMRNHFTIYRSNSNLIGCIPDDQLREFIVKSYIGAQVLIDTYNDYRKLLENFKRSAYIAGKTQNESDKFIADTEMKFLKVYTTSLKSYHELVKNQIHALIKLLNEKITIIQV